MYFENRFPKEFGIKPDLKLINSSFFIHPENLEKVPEPGKPLTGNDFQEFVDRTAEEIAGILNLKRV